MTFKEFAQLYLAPVSVSLSVVLLVGAVSLYSEVQANTKFRETSEAKLDLLLEQSIIMSQDVKYLKEGVTELKLDVKEARNRELYPWRYQSSPE